MLAGYNKEQITFFILFYLTGVTMLLSDIDMYSIFTVLRKVKYLYIIAVSFFVLNRWIRMDRIKKGTGYLPLSILMAHTIIFGYFFVSPRVEIATKEHVQQMLIFYITVLVTYAYVIENNLYMEIIKLSFWASFTQIMFCALLHPRDFVNPLWGLYQTFTADIRYKLSFGFTHSGWTANACYLFIILTAFYMYISYRENSIKRIWPFLLTSLGIGSLMLISTAQRSGILATFIFLCVLCLFYFFERIDNKHKTLFIFIGSIVFIIFTVVSLNLGIIDVLIERSNRTNNITVNYPVFKQIGNFWTGMGFVESSGFQDMVCVYGVRTWSLDMYYPYVFFTTGFIGCLLVFSSLLFLLIRIFINRKKTYGLLIFSLFISNLLFATSQTNLFTYRYATSFFITVLFLLGCDLKKENNYVI